MNLLQQNSLHLINLSEFCEVNPMGCISMPMGLVLQTPSFGVVSNVRRKEHSCVLVNRRRNYIKNAISGTQMESNIVVKEDAEFKSSFDEYLKAMESIRADREKQVQNGSTHGKKPTNVAFRKDVLQNRKYSETVESSFKVDREKKQFQRGSGHGQKSIDIALRKDVSRGRKRGETIESSFDREKKQVQRGSDHGNKSIDIAFDKEVSQSSKRSESVEFSVRADKGKKQVHGGSGHRKESIDVVFGKDVLEDWKHGETVASSIIVDRKQQVQGSGHGKKLIDVSSNKGFKEHSKRDDTVKFNRFKRSDFDEGDEHSKRTERVADKKMLGGSVQARYSVESQGSKNSSSKRSDVEATTSTSNKIVKKKSMRMEQMSDDNEIEMERFLFDSSDVLNDGLDGPRVSQMEMEERIQTLAKCLNEAGVDMPQWMFAKTMRSARIRYSDSSILRVIQILGKFGNWQRVLQMIEWLQMHERFQSRKPRYVYTAALDVLGKARRPVEALNLFCLMQRHKTTYPDIVTYRSIAVTLGQAGHMKELFDVIDSMRSMPTNFKIDVLDEWDPRIEPDIVIYNAVLNSCVKRKEWEGAIWVLRKLEEMGEQPSSTTYGLAMEVMLACGKYDLVHEYYKRLLGSSVPNALTYKVLVNTLWREGKPDEAIAVVQDMENRGLLGSASLYYDLARCLCSVGRCEEGLMQVDKICKVASKPLVVTFTGLIQACLTSGNIHDAASIFNHMQKYCSPNFVTYNIMLKAFLGYEMLDEAKELFRKIIQSEDKRRKVKSKIKPDLSTFTMMLEAFVREKKWDDFEYAYDQMLQYGYPFNTKHHLWMVLKASCAGKDETVEITWRHLLRFNRIPPPKLIKERFRLKMESNDLVEAFSSVSCHPSSHQESFSKEAWLKLLQDNEHCFKKEALEHLISEINNFLSKSQSPNIIYQNLLDSCMEFVNMTQ